MPTIDVYCTPDGKVRALYSPAAAAVLKELGECQAPRVSDVEFDDAAQGWFADLSRIGGPRIGPFPLDQRDAAIAAEVDWIVSNYLDKS